MPEYVRDTLQQRLVPDLICCRVFFAQLAGRPIKESKKALSITTRSGKFFEGLADSLLAFLSIMPNPRTRYPVRVSCHG
jgi:hypothetical protein